MNISCALLICLSLFAHSAAAQAPVRPEIDGFIDEMAAKHQFDREALRRVFGRLQPRQAILRAMYAPGTSRPWYEFRKNHVDAARVAEGVRFWMRNAETLARAAREYGVPEEIIVATIGIETFYGRNTGSFRVIEALATLAFDYPERAVFFRGELEEFLLLSRESKVDLVNTRGSFAGAMGIPQFLPSSYRRYAIDFDGNGIRYLWGDPADSIGSVANYYRAFGWRTGEAVVVAAEAGESDIDAMLAAGIKPETEIAEWRRRGLVPVQPVSDTAVAAVFVLETESGPRYWLGLQNFYVITRYNRSVNYAMAVYELAREVRSLVKGISPEPMAVR